MRALSWALLYTWELNYESTDNIIKEDLEKSGNSKNNQGRLQTSINWTFLEQLLWSINQFLFFFRFWKYVC